MMDTGVHALMMARDCVEIGHFNLSHEAISKAQHCCIFRLPLVTPLN